MSRTFTSRVLSFAVFAIIAAFWAATVLSQVLASRIDAASDKIAFNSSPSIELLATVRGEVGQLEVHLDKYVDALAVGAAADRRRVDQSLAAVNEAVMAYLKLPTFPGETVHWVALEQALRDLNRDVQQALVLVERGAGLESQQVVAGDVRSSAERLTGAALEAIEFNARNGRELALGIKNTRRHAAVIGWGLNVLAGALAILMIAIVHRTFHRELREEQMRLLAQRAEELEAFAGRVAHDLMSPVGAAVMALGLIGRTAADERSQQLVQRALSSLQRSRTLVDDLLAFSRAGAKPEPGARSDVGAVVRGVVSEIGPSAIESGVTIELDQQESCATACPSGVLGSLVSNLVWNAVKHMGEATTRRVSVRVRPNATHVVIEVVDTGPGLPRELGAAVFEPFVRGRGATQPGIGLGLATVKRLAEGYGGAVGVRSRPGDGSTFRVELPRADDSPPQLDAKSS